MGMAGQRMHPTRLAIPTYPGSDLISMDNANTGHARTCGGPLGLGVRLLLLAGRWKDTELLEKWDKPGVLVVVLVKGGSASNLRHRENTHRTFPSLASQICVVRHMEVLLHHIQTWSLLATH